MSATEMAVELDGHEYAKDHLVLVVKLRRFHQLAPRVRIATWLVRLASVIGWMDFRVEFLEGDDEGAE